MRPPKATSSSAVSMRILDLHREMTWVAVGASRFESDWMAWHRFLWMNAITGTDLGKVLTVQPNPQVSLSRYLALVTSTPLICAFARHFQARSPISCFGHGIGREVLNVQCIRYCPACLRACFHSPLFQLACLKACPFHGCELVTICTSCGSRIGQPMVHPPAIGSPLTCMSCHRPFVDDDIAEAALGGFAPGERLFGQLESWMARIRSSQFLGSMGFEEESGSPRDYKTICACVVRQAGRVRGSKAWLNDDFPCVPLVHKKQDEIPKLRQFVARRWELPLNPDIDAACAIAKSVGRQIARRIREICGHRHTAVLPWRNAIGPFVPVEPVLLFSPHDCPCCAILCQWRAYAGKVLALRNQARLVRLPVYESSLGEFRVSYCLEPTEFARALLSSFTWFASALYRVVRYFAEIDTQLWYQGEKELLTQRLATANVVPLATHRFEISPCGYEFESRGQQIEFAYSLEHAQRVLQTCHELYRTRKYWITLSSEPQGIPRGAPDNGYWYIGMSEYLQALPGSWKWQCARFPVPSGNFCDM